MPVSQTQLFLGDIQLPFYYLGEEQVSLFPKTTPIVTRTGLVFDIDATKLDSYPGSGSTWNSIGGGPNMIAFTSSAFPTWDATNKQFNFNGYDNVLIGNFTSSISSSTMITWAKIGTTNPTGSAEGGGMNYGSRVVGNVQANWNAISYDEAGVGNRWRMVSAGGFGAIESVIQTDTVYDLVAAVRDGVNYSLYVNGVLQGIATAPASSFTTGSYLVGSRFINTGNTPVGYFTGSISRVAVYDRALSQGEINDLYELGRFGG